MLRNSRLRCLACLGAELARRGQPSRTLRQRVDSHIEVLRFLQEVAPGEIERDEFDLWFWIINSSIGPVSEGHHVRRAPRSRPQVLEITDIMDMA